MVIAGLLIFSYLLGMIPSQFIYQKVVPLKKLQYVRSDYITSLDVIKHIKEPAFFLTVGTDFLKGLILGLLGMAFSESGTLTLIMLLIAIIARNFNVFIGIRNGVGMAILIGGIVIYAPIVLIPMMLFTLIFGFFMNDLNIAFILSVVIMTVSLAFLNDPIGATFVAFVIMAVMITHQLKYTEEAAKRTKYEDSKYHNPYD
ncbi:MAG: glycerol-3-phosphate acyltransferase [Bacillota bacterium]